MPVMTSSVRLHIVADPQRGIFFGDLCSDRESLPSSPRVFGVTARPTMGVGN